MKKFFKDDCFAIFTETPILLCLPDSKMLGI